MLDLLLVFRVVKIISAVRKRLFLFRISFCFLLICKTPTEQDPAMAAIEEGQWEDQSPALPHDLPFLTEIWYWRFADCWCAAAFCCSEHCAGTVSDTVASGIIPNVIYC